MTKPVSIMIVEDSPVARELLTNALNSDPRLQVTCAVESGEKALRLVAGIAPDVISMDIRLPGMNGIETTRRIMELRPTPIVVVAADLRSETINSSMEALRAGALSVVEKPRIETAESYKAMARRLCEQFVNMSSVKVVRQRFNGPRIRVPRTGLPIAVDGPPAYDGVAVVGIAASTGGPPAVASVLQGLGRDFPAPILIVQHMGSEFLEGYAGWLDSVCDIPVVLAEDDREPRPGVAYVGPGRHHLVYRAGRLRLIPDSAERGHIPSGDVLFRSLAVAAGAKAVGVILTGMGDDGARGLLDMRNAGARTIGQNRETAAVYGMPAAAMALGAVAEELPIGMIARRLVKFAADSRSAPARLAAPRVRRAEAP